MDQPSLMARAHASRHGGTEERFLELRMPPRWGYLLVLFLALLLACVLTFPGLLVDFTLYPGQHLQPAERAKAVNDVRTTLLQGLAGLAVLYGALMTWLQMQTGRDQLQHNVEASRKQLRAGRRGQTAERFTKAIDQLDYTRSLEVRLGAIYALGRIARHSKKDHWPVMQVLTAYVREHAPCVRKTSITEALTTYVRQNAPWILRDTRTSSLKEPPPAADIQAILTVIGQARGQLRPEMEPQQLDLKSTDLRSADLTEAHLQGVILSYAHLDGAKLGGAHLEGVVLLHASLKGAILWDTHLNENAVLEGTDFTGAHFKQTHLNGAKLKLATGLTLEQINNADGANPDELPDYLNPPATGQT